MFKNKIVKFLPFFFVLVYLMACQISVKIEPRLPVQQPTPVTTVQAVATTSPLCTKFREDLINSSLKGKCIQDLGGIWIGFSDTDAEWVTTVTIDGKEEMLFATFGDAVESNNRYLFLTVDGSTYNYYVLQPDGYIYLKENHQLTLLPTGSNPSVENALSEQFMKYYTLESHWAVLK